MITTVVNIRKAKPGYVRIDRSTIFGNPFRITPLRTRVQSIAEFREYFYKRLEDDPEFRLDVQALEGRRLGCWCKPLPCHGDVMAEYLNERSGVQNAIRN